MDETLDRFAYTVVLFSRGMARMPPDLFLL